MQELDNGEQFCDWLVSEHGIVVKTCELTPALFALNEISEFERKPLEIFYSTP